MTDPCCRYHTTAVVLTTIYSPFTEGTSRVMKTNEGNSLLWGASVAGSLFGPRGSVAWLPVLGPSVVVGSLPLPHRNNSTTTTTPPPTSYESIRSLLLHYLLSNLSFHPTHPTIRIISRILGNLGPRACLISYQESPSHSLQKERGSEKADHLNHIGPGIQLQV